MRICVETATEQFEECAEWEDQGYETCDRWDESCCDWWPCSWGCKLISWICVATVWVSNVVCIAWNITTTTVCIAWEIVSTVVTAAALLIEWIQAIPIIGRIIDMVMNVITTIIWRYIQAHFAILDLIGIRPLKKLDLCIIILRDENGTPTTTEAILQPAIADTVDIFRDEADIHVHVSGIHTVTGPSPTYALDVDCNLAAFAEDLGLPGSYFQAMTNLHCTLGATSRVTGFRNQMVVFCVRELPGTTAGCALGPLNDYLTIEGQNPLCLAHEVGHKVGLWHCCPGTNLANGTCGGTLLQFWQMMIVRNSKYVSYF